MSPARLARCLRDVGEGEYGELEEVGEGLAVVVDCISRSSTRGGKDSEVVSSLHHHQTITI
jgi:hypothetical protein